MIKQRQESVELYQKGGRAELVAQEQERDRDHLGLPAAQMSARMKSATVIAALVKETGATAMKDMGRVMAAMKERYAGKLDFRQGERRGEEAAERGVVRVPARKPLRPCE